MPRSHQVGLAGMLVSATGETEPQAVVSNGPDSSCVLRLAGQWTLEHRAPRLSGIVDQIESGSATAVGFNLDGLKAWDSSLVAFLLAFSDHARSAGWLLDWSGLPPSLVKLLQMADAVPPPPTETAGSRSSLLARIGLKAGEVLGRVGGVCSLIGEIMLALGRLFLGRAKFYRPEAWTVLEAVSARALFIVCIVNLLVGAIMAFIGAVQLQRFGAAVFVADGVAIATVREMGAVATAIVLSGRTGAAFAAQIATMQGNEEVDALRTMGVSPVEFLVLPRVLALAAMMPLLYIYGSASGIFGGYLVAALMLDISSVAYFDRAFAAIDLNHFLIGFSKSVVFGILIAIAGCYYGLRAGRNAAAVGQATTSAVVAGIVGVIVVDAVFAVCANALGV